MKRLFQDPTLHSEIRRDLLRSRAAGRDYPAVAKIMQLRAALAKQLRLATAEPGELTLAFQVLGGQLLHTFTTLAVGAAVGGMIVALVVPPRVVHELALPQPSATTSSSLKVDAERSLAMTPAKEPVASNLPASQHAEVRSNTSATRREINQMVRIRALLDRAPAEAARLARRSRREFPRGVLSEERQALLIVALAQSGALASARREASDFFARYPQSILRSMVETALRRVGT